MIACLHCGQGFQPRRKGHVFCSSVCRYRGERPVSERVANDESLKRLFDPTRDPEEFVRDDDWHPAAGTPFAELDWMHTVGKRRSWYLRLMEDGSL